MSTVASRIPEVFQYASTSGTTIVIDFSDLTDHTRAPALSRSPRCGAAIRKSSEPVHIRISVVVARLESLGPGSDSTQAVILMFFDEVN